MRTRLPLLLALGVLPGIALAEDKPKPAAPDYNRQVAPIFRKYCVACHAADDPEAGLVLENYRRAMTGSKRGAVIVPGKSGRSRLLLMVQKKVKPFMPPKDNDAPNAVEIAVLKAWIDSGARGPQGAEPLPARPRVPSVKTVGPVRRPVHAVAVAPDGTRLVAGRATQLELLDPRSLKSSRLLDGPGGHINDVGFSRDGSVLFAAGGEPGLFGEVRLLDAKDLSVKLTIRGHRDSLYAAALSPDGRVLATGSYDRTIRLWNAADGKPLLTLKGHNGAVFDLAFHPGGKILASASGDRTVKLWNTADGRRLDTFNEPTREQYAVAISPDGRYVVAGGVDNRIRAWEILEGGREGTNPVRFSRFAHKQSILALEFSPDGLALVSSSEDRSVKVWETKTFTQRRQLPLQPDWPSALAITPGGRRIIVGRLDGSLAAYELDPATLAAAGAATPVTGSPVPKPHEGDPKAKLSESVEAEPNNTSKQAMPLLVPGSVTGVLAGGDPADVDVYRFESKAGQSWIVETRAARDKSPADTRIEVLDAAGRPVLRLLLRAVRDSAITFRPIDSKQNQARLENWEEMQLNQFLFMAGEVVKFFRMPQGPDSAMQFYTINSRRKCYFDTSATAHPRDSAVFVVEPHRPGATFPDNGLPVFRLNYANDDDGDRRLGSDSRLTFTAGADGVYFVRVSEVRGFGGPQYKYRLTIRPPRPDFGVSVGGKGATIPVGSGKRFTVKVDRRDGFNGPVRVEIAGLPAGFRATTPLVIEAGHLEARGAITAAADAAGPAKDAWKKVTVTATAEVLGKQVTHQVGDLGEIKLGEKPKYTVTLSAKHPRKDAVEGEPELVIVPGTTIPAMLRIERNGFKGELRFDVDNLPHGVIVDNLGLSGIMIREGESEREVFITAAKRVPETERRVHAVARAEGNLVSPSIRIAVRAAARR